MPDDGSISPVHSKKDEQIVSEDKPVKQMTPPFLDSCEDNALDAEDSQVKTLHTILFNSTSTLYKEI